MSDKADLKRIKADLEEAQAEIETASKIDDSLGGSLSFGFGSLLAPSASCLLEPMTMRAKSASMI
jgi:hypothetical protein